MAWNKVALVGAGMIKFGELFDKTYEGMFEEAYLNCINSVDKGFDPKDIQYAWFGAYDHGLVDARATVAGSTLVGSLGLSGIQAMRVEAGCPTGQLAVQGAAMSIASGIADVALAVGVEKMREGPTAGLLGLAVKGHVIERGATAMNMFACQAVRYMYEFGSTIDHLSMVSVKNRHNGSFNPFAHYSTPVTAEDCMKSPLVCYPYHILHCCPQTDGAAAIILCNADIASKYTDKPVYLAGFGIGTEVEYTHEMESFTGFRCTREAAKRAYAMAGMGPEDLDLAEVHDCFSSQEIINYEDLGFCEKGQGAKLLEKGEWNLDGRLPVNPSGGLICEGHPIGATGVRQSVECYWQLRGDVIEKQHSKRQAEIKKGNALQHNVGGRGVSNSGVIIWTLNP